MYELATQGFGLADFALFLNRVTLGLFYVLARFRFFYDPSKPGARLSEDFGPDYPRYRIRSQRWLNTDRHWSLREKVRKCGFKRAPYFWAYVVAIVEVAGGALLVAGVFAPVMAGALFILTAVATSCTARQKVMEQQPCDLIDCAACYLWRVEGLYLVMAAAVIAGGPGAWSLT